MDRKARLRERLKFWERVYEQLQEGYIQLLEGKVKSYLISDRQLTYHSIEDIRAAMEEAEEKIDELEAVLNGKAARKAVGVVLRDW